MNKTIDNETLLLKVESHEHRIEVLENLLRMMPRGIDTGGSSLLHGYIKEQSLQDDPQA
jgi:hypothetical protein